MKWQPIETAPKDGARVLVSAVGQDTFIACWDCEFRIWAQSYDWNSTVDEFQPVPPEYEPTHWMPLPEIIEE